MPIAAFSGRRSLIPLATPEGPVQAVLLAGKLRAVADETPAARLLLDGAPEAVLGPAARLAADLPLLPPAPPWPRRAAPWPAARRRAPAAAARPTWPRPARSRRRCSPRSAICWR